MATWVTHLMIADAIVEKMPKIDAQAFCVGNIAPDCNVENADWTAFDPPREVTHFMDGEKKDEGCAERFYEEYICGNHGDARESAFLWGYYAHLVTDGLFQKMIVDEARVAAMWRRIHAQPDFTERAQDVTEDWNTAKKLFFPKPLRFREMNAIEAEYLREHPDSGYLKHILPLEDFPDYLPFLPHGSIVRKIGVMGTLPEASDVEPMCVSREEYAAFVRQTVEFLLCHSPLTREIVVL